MSCRIWTATVKGGKTNRIPLSDAAVAILRAQQGQHTTYVFPSPQTHRPLSHAAFGRILKAAGIDSTTHGFRSCFSTWAHDETEHAHDTIEICMAYGRKRRQSGIRQRRQVRKAPRPDGGLVGVRDREPVTPAPAGWTAPPTCGAGLFCVRRAARPWLALYGRSRLRHAPVSLTAARRRTAVPEGEPVGRMLIG